MLNLRENMELVYQREEPEYMPFMSDFDVASLDALDFVNERPVVPGVNKDWFGQSWTYEPKVKAANPTPGCPLVTDITLWKEQMTFPDIDALDWEGHAARDTASWDRKNKMSRITIGFGLWERMFSVMPFDDALCALMEEPEACYDFFSAVADHKIRLHDKILKYYKPDILVMHDDYGTSQGLFMSVKVWRELIKPHLNHKIQCKLLSAQARIPLTGSGPRRRCHTRPPQASLSHILFTFPRLRESQQQMKILHRHGIGDSHG